MSATSTVHRNKTVDLAMDLLSNLFGGRATQKVGVRLWDGTNWPDDAPRPAILVLNHPGALRAMFQSRTELGLAEAYLFDDFDIEGDVETIFDLADGLSEKATSWHWKLQVTRDLLRLPAGRQRRPILLQHLRLPRW